MKTNFFKFIIFSILFLSSDCTRECVDCGLGSTVANYVQKYLEIDSAFTFSVSEFNDEDSAHIRCVLSFRSRLISNFSDDSLVRAKFSRYAAMNRDTNYFQPIGTCFIETCLPFGGNRFDVYCEQDYGEIPAGQSLNDVFTIYCSSVQKFVESGYSEPSPNDAGYISHERIDDTLTNFNRLNIRLLSTYNMQLHFWAIPLEPGDYKFIFKYSDDSGVELTDTVAWAKNY